MAVKRTLQLKPRYLFLTHTAPRGVSTLEETGYRGGQNVAMNTVAEDAALRKRIFSSLDVQNISLYFQWLFGAKHSAATEGPLSWTLASATKKLG